MKSLDEWLHHIEKDGIWSLIDALILVKQLCLKILLKY